MRRPTGRTRGESPRDRLLREWAAARTESDRERILRQWIELFPEAVTAR